MLPHRQVADGDRHYANRAEGASGGVAKAGPIDAAIAAYQRAIAANANDLEAHAKLLRDLKTLPPGASDEQARQVFANVGEDLFALSKCPDYVVNRGHYFGTAEFNRQDGLSADERAFGTEPELGDADKRALIAFLKTF